MSPKKKGIARPKKAVKATKGAARRSTRRKATTASNDNDNDITNNPAPIRVNTDPSNRQRTRARLAAAKDPKEISPVVNVEWGGDPDAYAKKKAAEEQKGDQQGEEAQADQSGEKDVLAAETQETKEQSPPIPADYPALSSDDPNVWHKRADELVAILQTHRSLLHLRENVLLARELEALAVNLRRRPDFAEGAKFYGDLKRYAELVGVADKERQGAQVSPVDDADPEIQAHESEQDGEVPESQAEVQQATEKELATSSAEQDDEAPNGPSGEARSEREARQDALPAWVSRATDVERTQEEEEQYQRSLAESVAPVAQFTPDAPSPAVSQDTPPNGVSPVASLKEEPAVEHQPPSSTKNVSVAGVKRERSSSNVEEEHQDAAKRQKADEEDAKLEQLLDSTHNDAIQQFGPPTTTEPDCSDLPATPFTDQPAFGADSAARLSNGIPIDRSDSEDYESSSLFGDSDDGQDVAVVSEDAPSIPKSVVSPSVVRLQTPSSNVPSPAARGSPVISNSSLPWVPKTPSQRSSPTKTSDEAQPPGLCSRHDHTAVEPSTPAMPQPGRQTSPTSVQPRSSSSVAAHASARPYLPPAASISQEETSPFGAQPSSTEGAETFNDAIDHTTKGSPDSAHRVEGKIKSPSIVLNVNAAPDIQTQEDKHNEDADEDDLEAQLKKGLEADDEAPLIAIRAQKAHAEGRRLFDALSGRRFGQGDIIDEDERLEQERIEAERLEREEREGRDSKPRARGIHELYALENPANNRDGDDDDEVDFGEFGGGEVGDDDDDDGDDSEGRWT